MGKSLQFIFFVLAISVLLTNCRKKQWEEYYGRPDDLEAPIYQQLQAREHFTHLLALIDKSGYKATLSAAGYWTLFAPDDEAFSQYFQEKGITGIDDIDNATAQAMVQYMLVYNAFNKDRLDDYQSNAGWVTGTAFRRRTAYYTGFYKDTLQNGEAVTAVTANRNGLFYLPTDNNNKYIPYFIDDYFATKGLSAADYSYFYPATPYTGFNVAHAKVTEKDIAAENGVIHVIDKVISPLPSIDQYLRGKPEFSDFKKLLDRYGALFVISTDATNKYQLLTGKGEQVYIKNFVNALAFAPNNENYLKLQDNDGQQDSWTLFAPKNDVLKSYLDTVLLEHYDSLPQLPPQVITDFLNAHMFQSAVWPSKFKTTANIQGEEARFDAASDVIDRKVLSNGLFYGTSKVQRANVFSTIYAKAYLDPQYSLMTRLLDMELKFIITSPAIRFTMFMLSNNALLQAGYDYDPTLNQWSYTPPGGVRTTGEAVRQRLLRILNMCTIYTPKNELDDLSGTGVIETNGGEFIKFYRDTVVAAGNEDIAKPVKVNGHKVAANGRVYYIGDILRFTELNIGKHIEKLGMAPETAPDFSHFWNYLKSANGVYNSATGEIIGTAPGTFYTVFIPTNAAMQQAVNDGVLPGTVTATGKVPNFTPSLAAEKELVNRFIQYHILNKKTVIPDREEAKGYETLLKNLVGDALSITVFSLPGSMYLRDVNTRRADVIVAKSNNLSNRCVIHLIDTYLKYN